MCVRGSHLGPQEVGLTTREPVKATSRDTALGPAALVLERVRAAIADKPFETTRDSPVAVSVSIERRESMASLLERASAKLLQAKSGGNNRVVV